MSNALDHRLELLDRELREVDLQEAAGELDAATADRLRRTYREEREEVAAQKARIEDAADPPTRDPRRLLAGAALLVTSFIVVAVAAVSALSEGEPSPLTTGDDLSDVSNEAMLAVIEGNADNPQINAMRLALAERYFEEFDYSSALPQYQAVLDNAPSALEATEALARMGWMVHASGASEVAESLLLRSLEANPSNTEAQWFLALVYLDVDRACDADRILSGLRDDPAVPIDAAAQVASVADSAAIECAG